MRPFPGDRQTPRSGRLGRLRLLRQPFALLLGACGCTWSAPSHGLPVGFALTGAKADERETLLGILTADPTLLVGRDDQTLIADKNYYGRQFEADLTELGVRLLRPARKRERPRAGAHLFKPLRQVIESINNRTYAVRVGRRG
jgi:hypothetical protein